MAFGCVMPGRFLRVAVLCGLLSGLGSGEAVPTAWAAADRPLVLVVSTTLGGATDLLARAFAEPLARKLGQPVVVENTTGQTGMEGAKRVLRAAPDGYTLLFGTTSDLVGAPLSLRDPHYATRDFTAIAKISAAPMVLVGRASLKVGTFDAVVDMARQRPGGLTIATAGARSSQAFAALALMRATDTTMVNVPYRGGEPLMEDLLRGQVDLAISSLPGVRAYARDGKLRVFGLLAPTRSSLAPEIPALSETTALRVVAFDLWAGLAGPAHLPDAVVLRLDAAVRAVLSDEDFRRSRLMAGDDIERSTSPSSFRQFMANEEARYRALASIPQR